VAVEAGSLRAVAVLILPPARRADGLSVKTGQTHVQAPEGHRMFKEQQNEVTKVVLKPGATLQ